MITIFVYMLKACFYLTIGALAMPVLLVYGIYKLFTGESKVNNSSYKSTGNIKTEIPPMVIQEQNVSENVIYEDKNSYSYRVKNIYDGSDFEYFCSDLLRENGFENVIVTPKSNDFGVDITAETKDHVKYAFQCKFYSSTLNNTPIQEVSAGMYYYNCHVGVVITNSKFTQNAKELARKANVLLWDSDKLSDLIRIADKNRK